MAINFPHNPNINDVHTEASLGRSWKWDGTTWSIYSSTTTGIAFGDLSVSQQAASGSGSLTYNNAGIFTYTPPAGGGGGGSSTFTGLSDTPSSLTAGKWLKVNTGGTALEWTDAPSGSDTNDYVSSASLSGNTLTLGRTGSQSLANITVDLSSLNNVPTTITVADESADTECYPLFAKDATGNIAPKTGTNIKFNSSSGQLEAGSFKKTGGSSAEFLKADGSIDSTTYLSSNPSYALNDLSDVDATTGVANGKILKYNGTSWEVADDQSSGGGSGNFTGLSDTPNSLTAGKWLKVNVGGTALEWTDAPADTNTTYDLSAVADSGNAKVRLAGSDSTNDDVTFSAGGGISYAVTGNTVQISSANSLGALTDVTISGSPSNGQVLKYDGSTWVNGTDATGGASQNLFSTFAVAGQSNVVADTSTDTLTFSAGSNMTITTDANNDVITFASAGTGSLNIKYLQDVGSANNNYISYFTGVLGSYANYQFDTNYPTGFYSQSWNNWGGWINPWNAGGQQGDGLIFFTLSDNSETTWELKLHSTSPNTSLTSGNQCRCWTSTDGENWVYQGANNTISTTTTISITTAYLIVTDLGMGSGNEVYLEVGSSSIAGVNYLRKDGLSVNKLANSGTGDLTYNNAGILTYTPPASTTTTINSNADNRIITGSASANTLNAESSLTYDGNSLFFSDDKAIKFGSNLRMQMYTDGSINYIKSATDGSGAFPISIHSGSSEVINIDDGNTQIKTGLKDKDGDLGTAGQILSSTGTQVNWIDAAGGGTNTTYDLAAAADSGNAKITLSGSDSTNDDVNLTAGGGISYAVTGNTIQITSANSLGALTDVTISGSPSNGQVLKYNGSAWVNGTDSSGGGADGNDYVTNLSLSGTTLTAEFSTTSLNQSIDLSSINTNTQLSTEDVQDIVGGMVDGGTETRIGVTYDDTSGKLNFVVDDQSSDNNTTYDLSATSSSGNAVVRLAGSDSTNDDVTLSAGGGISYSVTGNTIQITSSNSLGGLSDVDISSSPSSGQVLKFNGSQWAPAADASGGGADGNNYANSLSFNTGNGVLTVGRSGLGDLTVDLDGRYGTSSFSGSYNDLSNKPTIPTNNNQLTNGAGYGTSSFSGSYNDLSNKPTIPTNNNQLTNGAGYGTSNFSGSYTDLSNKPTIPTNNNQLTNGAGYLTSVAGAAMTGNSKITVRTSGSGTHTTQSWCRSIVAIAVGGGGGGGNAWYQYDDDDGTSQGRGGSGGAGGHKYYTGSVNGAQGFAYSIGGGGSGQSQGSCDDNVANGASGGSTSFGGVTAGGGGGGAGTFYGTGSNGADGSGDAIFFQTSYGSGGAGASGRSGDGCQGSAGSGTGGAVFILELG